MSDAPSAVAPDPVQSPPPAERPEAPEPDPRQRLTALAEQLRRRDDHRALAEYLEQRRALRA